MKRTIPTVLWSILSSLLTVGFLIIALLILRPYLPGMFSPPVATPITSPAPSTATVITSTLSYGDALKTYEGVATSAIRASERALDTVKWLVGALLGLITVATGVAAYLYKTAREAGEKAQVAEEAAQAAKEAANYARGQLETILERHIRLSEQYVELKGKTLSLDAALQAWDRGEVSRRKVMEAQQWESWVKWQKHKDDTGWLELREEADFGGGLTPVLGLAVEMELERVRRLASKTGSQSNAEKEYEQRLQDLLHPQSAE